MDLQALGSWLGGRQVAAVETEKGDAMQFDLDVASYRANGDEVKFKRALLDAALQADQDQRARKGALQALGLMIQAAELKAAELHARLPGLRQAVTDAEGPRRDAWQQKWAWVGALGHGVTTPEERETLAGFDKRILDTAESSNQAIGALERAERAAADADGDVAMLNRVRGSL